MEKKKKKRMIAIQCPYIGITLSNVNRKKEKEGEEKINLNGFCLACFQMKETGNAIQIYGKLKTGNIGIKNKQGKTKITPSD